SDASDRLPSQRLCSRRGRGPEVGVIRQIQGLPRGCARLSPRLQGHRWEVHGLSVRLRPGTSQNVRPTRRLGARPRDADPTTGAVRAPQLPLEEVSETSSRRAARVQASRRARRPRPPSRGRQRVLARSRRSSRRPRRRLPIAKAAVPRARASPGGRSALLRRRPGDGCKVAIHVCGPAVRSCMVSDMATTRSIELKTKIPGPRSREILQRKERVVAEPLSVYLPVVIEEGRADCFNAGTEAIANAIKFARSYTKRPAVIAFEGGFHGRTLLSMSLTSKTHPYKAGLGPFSPEVYRVPFAQDYRGPTAAEALGDLERALVTQIAAEQVAAIVIEPVQGEGGFVVAPREFLRGVRRICDE